MDIEQAGRFLWLCRELMKLRERYKAHWGATDFIVMADRWIESHKKNCQRFTEGIKDADNL